MPRNKDATGIATRNKDATGVPGHTTRSKDATSNKKLLTKTSLQTCQSHGLKPTSDGLHPSTTECAKTLDCGPAGKPSLSKSLC